MPPQASEITALVNDGQSMSTSSSSTNYDPSQTIQHFSFRSKSDVQSNRNRKRTLWSVSVAACFALAAIALFSHSRAMSDANSLTQKTSTNSKYKRVQGMGFQIYTGGAPALLHHSDGSSYLNPECVGRSSYGQVVGEIAPELQCYIGLQDPMLDVRRRVEIMADAVEKAYELSANDDAGTLKIFLAPEFFWRGLKGAYFFREDEQPEDPSICGPICQILMGLEGIAAQKRFEDWIFLFGTIIASDILPNDDPFDYEFYNFAPLYKGYDPDKMGFEGKRFLLPKRYVSSSDFLTPQRHLNSSVFKELLGTKLPQHQTTVYNPHDFDQKRYDNSMWKKYKEELSSLGYVYSRRQRHNRYALAASNRYALLSFHAGTP